MSKMRRRDFIAGLGATAIPFTAHGQATDEAEVVSFQSSSYTDFRQLIGQEALAPNITIRGTLSFPHQARRPYPALVIAHTIGGYRDANEGWHSVEFRKAGFATLTYDSFSERGLNESAVISAGSGPLASAVADAFAALRLLGRHPQIDSRRIAIVGFSFGGEIAHLAAFERFRSMFGADQRFAAHVAYYPAGVYGTVASKGAYTGAPILMMLGEKDDNLPVAKVEAYLSYARAAGEPAPMEVIIYPGAYHAWTVSTLGAPRFYPQYGSTRKCPFILLGSNELSFLIDGQAKPFDSSAIAACLGEGQGYSMAYDASIRASSTFDTVRFLRENLSP